MRLALDTSVLVAVLVEPHPLHRRVLPWLEAIESGEVGAECSTHALAETWSVLTRLPIEPAISPTMAAVAVERVAELVRVVELDAALYRCAIRRCSERGLRSGALFDALHLVAAEATGAEAFVTFNPGDFERLAADASPRLVVPPDPPECRLPDL